jgi:5-methylthioadenosine/S-adenosylhomocysteine deaminase
MTETPVVDTLIVHGYVATIDPQRRVFADGAVAVRDGVIADIGPTERLSASYPDAGEILDVGGDLVMPGMVDAHRHLGLLLHELLNQRQGGWPERLTRHPFESGGDIAALVRASAQPGSLAPGAEPEDTYAAARVGALESLRSGVTCLNDGGGGDGGAIAQAAHDVGMRAAVTVACADLTVEGGRPRRARDTDQLLAEVEGLASAWHGVDGRIRAWANLFFPVGASDELCAGTQELVARLGLGVGGHAAALKNEDAFSVAWHGLGTIDRLDRFGLLSPALLGAHMGYVEDRHIGRLAETDVRVAHCPTSSSILPAGYFTHGQIPKLQRAGVTLGLGTDNGGRGSLVHQMTHTSFHKDRWMDSATMDAPFVFEMATLHGARATHFDDLIGSLEIGKRADIVVVDRSDLRWEGWDPIRLFVEAGVVTDVSMVFVDGELKVRDGTVLGVDEEEVRRELRAAVVRLRNRLQRPRTT